MDVSVFIESPVFSLPQREKHFYPFHIQRPQEGSCHNKPYPGMIQKE